MRTSCGELERLVRKVVLGFTVLFISGFLVLYYAIREVACGQGLCDSGSSYGTPPVYGADMVIMTFTVSVLFIAVLWYSSLRENEM